MPSQRPFFSNFLAAFRAHSAIQQSPSKAPSTSSSAQATHTTSASTSTSTSTSSTSTPRAISTASKSHAHTGSGPGTTSAALNTLHSPRTHSTTPLSISPGGPGASYGQNVNPVSPSVSPSDHPYPHHNPQSPHRPSAGRYMSSRMQRRGSDSSSEGFRDVLGAEKWYIGGRTAGGEERFFKLGVVRRQRSGDRLSFDQLSL